MRSGSNNSAEIKKLKSLLLKFISNNMFLSLIISAAIIYLLPPLFEKYKIEIVSQSYKDPDGSIYYCDFNNDDISERILFGQFNTDFFNLMIYEKGKVIEQWNFDGSYVKTNEPIISPNNPQNLKSIYFFVYKSNRISLYKINPFTKEIRTQDKFVEDYFPRMEGDPCQVFPLIFYDSDNDGVKEFYFALDAGYSIQPRRLFRYDPARDSVYRAVKSYAVIPPRIVVDTAGQQLKLIYTSNAYGNSKFNDPYTDRYTWLMSYNKELNFIKPPEKKGVYPSHSSITTIKSNNKSYYVYQNIYEGTGRGSSSLCLLNSNLDVIKEKRFHFNPNWGNSTLYSDGISDYFFAVRQDGVVMKYNMQLEPVDSSSIIRITNDPYLDFDLDNDGKKELLYTSESVDKLIICRNDFSDYSTVAIPGANYITASIKYNGKKPGNLVVSTKNSLIELSYGFNKLFYLRYPIYGGIYLAVFLFLSLISKAQKHRAEIKYQTEKSIAELQLKAIKNQVDPHFTLNLINSIGTLFYKQDKEKADYIFGKYSRLLRATILNSDKIVTTLGEELDYVENYLELERYRNGYRFEWKIDFDEKADKEITVPKMLIHTFVENAIKHGLSHLEKDGLLYIGVSRNNQHYLITIRDNGVGRIRSSELEKENTGKGLGILDQILRLYDNLMKTKITYRINDISRDEKNTGTEIIIHIPE